MFMNIPSNEQIRHMIYSLKSQVRLNKIISVGEQFRFQKNVLRVGVLVMLVTFGW